MNGKEKLIAYCYLRLHGHSIEATEEIMNEIDEDMKALESESE